jgi:hypothetical protein
LSATKNVVFADTRRHLRRLAVTVRQWSAMAPLMRRFDSVKTLCLRTPSVWTISSFLSRFMSMNHLMHWLMLFFYCWLICQGIQGYKTFLDGANNLPKCEILRVTSLGLNGHAFEPGLLHLLRRGNTIRKLHIFFAYPSMVKFSAYFICLLLHAIIFEWANVASNLIIFCLQTLCSALMLDLFFIFRSLIALWIVHVAYPRVPWLIKSSLIHFKR